jgi:hypothetical protein
MKFIHFGCWNNGLCGDFEVNGLSLMTKKLREYVLINHPEFLIVAGDNYYPKKDATGKHFKLDEFKSGFECLPKNIKKYLIFGNHDIEDVIIEKTEPQKCMLITEQQKIADDDKTIEIFDNVIYKIIDNTLIIMLDSNLYDTKSEKLVKDTCYNHLFNDYVKKNALLTINDLLNYQNCFIKDLITSNISVHNIIFVAHHPIYSIKSKVTSNIVEKIDYELEKFVLFLKEIQELLLGKNIIYLCADTHLYQVGDINITPKLQIKQYIVGTGGAEQDNIYEGNNTIEKDSIIVYKKYDDKKEFGFLEVEILDDKITFKFISASSNLIGGNKYIKKYKILKSQINLF